MKAVLRLKLINKKLNIKIIEIDGLAERGQLT